MACYHPLNAYYTPDGRVVFSAAKNDTTHKIHLPCGQCVGCRLERSRQWAVRIMHEASLWDDNSFVTLTYNDTTIPPNGSLVYKHIQLFLKKLRKQTKKQIRFFCAGEYGAITKRPHYHICIFNENFRNDRYEWKKSNGHQLWRSNDLERIWQHGNAYIGELTFESAAYVARYICEKITGKRAQMHYGSIDITTGELITKSPEFAHMSLKPGIAANWLRLYWPDVANGKVITRGRESVAPKYYRKYFRQHDKRHDITDNLKELIHDEDQTEERLKTREEVTLKNLAKMKRNQQDNL